MIKKIKFKKNWIITQFLFNYFLKIIIIKKIIFLFMIQIFLKDLLKINNLFKLSLNLDILINDLIYI